MINSPREQNKNKVNVRSILVNRNNNNNPSSSDWIIFGHVFLFLDFFGNFIIEGHVDMSKLTSFHHKDNL